MIVDTHLGFKIIKVLSFKYQEHKKIFNFHQKTYLEDFSLHYQNPWDCRYPAAAKESK